MFIKHFGYGQRHVAQDTNPNADYPTTLKHEEPHFI